MACDGAILLAVEDTHAEGCKIFRVPHVKPVRVEIYLLRYFASGGQAH
jgi:hypothetical protein